MLLGGRELYGQHVAERTEDHLLLDVEELVELVLLGDLTLRGAPDDVQHVGIEAQAAPAQRGDHALYHVLRTQQASGPCTGGRIGVARFGQRHLIEERLDPRPLQNGQRIGDLEVRDHHVGQRIDQRLQLFAVRVESERQDGDRARLGARRHRGFPAF